MQHTIVHDPPTLGGARAILGALLKLAGLAILLIVILAFPAFSQQLGVRTLEFNTFGRYTDFGPATNLQSGVGGGLRLGYFVQPRWELEGGVGFTRVDRIAGRGTQNVVPVLFDVTYNYPIGWYQLLLGGGAVYYKYGSSHAWGTTLSAGVRLAFGPTAALRVDGTREYINRSDDVSRHSNWGFRLGLSWMLPKRSMTYEFLPISRAELAIPDAVRMPLLRESDPVAIMGLETDRARRDSVIRQDSIRSESLPRLAEAQIAALPRVELHYRMTTTIHFDVGSSEIRSDAIAALETKLDLLRGIPTLRIRIEGQADVRGSSASNITLAWKRAGAAKLWLTNRGIAADRIDAVGFGEGRPLCEDGYESCSSQNRRNEFVIVAGADAVARGTQ
jgi:outer membrane protein OmpA-like peptidoglycan-associated protein